MSVVFVVLERAARCESGEGVLFGFRALGMWECNFVNGMVVARYLRGSWCWLRLVRAGSLCQKSVDV